MPFLNFREHAGEFMKQVSFGKAVSGPAGGRGAWVIRRQDARQGSGPARFMKKALKRYAKPESCYLIT